MCRVVVSTEPLEEQTGDIMLPPQVVDFAADALASMGGSYTGEIEFSGGSARAIRRLSRHTSQVSSLPYYLPVSAAAPSRHGKRSNDQSVSQLIGVYDKEGLISLSVCILMWLYGCDGLHYAGGLAPRQSQHCPQGWDRCGISAYLITSYDQVTLKCQHGCTPAKDCVRIGFFCRLYSAKECIALTPNRQLHLENRHALQ